MSNILLAPIAMALSVPPVPPDSEIAARPDAICLAPDASSAASSSETLAEQASAAMADRNLARAQALSEQALTGSGGDTARAWALRMLVDLRMPAGNVEQLERMLACQELRGEAWTHARAWLAYRQGRYQDAATLLSPLVRPRHHTLPRWSIVHEDLGDTYDRLGRRADAQAQWLIALATDYDPGATGWSRPALERKLAAEWAEPAGAKPMLPLQRYHDAVSILDRASVERTEEGVRYSKLVLLQNDENRTAYGIDSWEVDCDRPRARVLGVHSFDSSGGEVRRMDNPQPWTDDRPGDPWLPTERRLVCSLETSHPIAPRPKSDLEMLRAYRSGTPIFE